MLLQLDRKLHSRMDVMVPNIVAQFVRWVTKLKSEADIENLISHWKIGIKLSTHLLHAIYTLNL